VTILIEPLDRRLPNGLRVVAHHDPTTPVVAVNVWYGVGSRREQPSRTGFAHLFEHLMFQGSRQVPGSGHFSMLQGVGASLNGTTSFDRTNYFETVTRHALDLALWLEADRMGSLLEAVTQENLDNQRDVVKNERRQRYDNVPYGTAYERLFAGLFPAGHPYHHLPIGSMADLDAASLEDVHAFFTTWYAPSKPSVPRLQHGSRRCVSSAPAPSKRCRARSRGSCSSRPPGSRSSSRRAARCLWPQPSWSSTRTGCCGRSPS